MDYPKTVDEVYAFLEDNEIVSQETLEVVTDINGYNMEALNNIVYSRTGYNDIEQLLECEYGMTDPELDEDMEI